ncbi:hypothetical protein CLG96_01990 [Sphingomonas oleivorans]|uniref:Transcriptional regulator n=1 Tax=Sphingomonas oleivorans TaxID=1735121 RepID=A0A2T5G323_9SPHN|nr:hypothetical protein CLG96_01990 [Sphingomonas oleivorans]
MKPTPTPLIDAIDEFVAHHRMSPITFGRKALSDPHFVGQLRAGRRVWPETEAKVRHFMATYRPVPASAEVKAA